MALVVRLREYMLVDDLLGDFIDRAVLIDGRDVFCGGMFSNLTDARVELLDEKACYSGRGERDESHPYRNAYTQSTGCSPGLRR